MSTLYQQLLDAGVSVDHHESDLYCAVTDASTKLIQEYYSVPERKSYKRATVFVDAITGKPWYSVPFAYDPFWDKK